MNLNERAFHLDYHVHNKEIGWGVAASPSASNIADIDTLTCFQSTCGNDTFGSWLQVLGTADTPVQTDYEKFDFHELLVCDVQATADQKIHRVEVGVGASGAQVVVTEKTFIPLRGGVALPIPLMCPLISSGAEVWVRHWVDSLNAQTMDFLFETHEYPNDATEEQEDADLAQTMANIIANNPKYARAFERVYNTLRIGNRDFDDILTTES